MFQKLISATGTLHLYIIGALILVIALLGLSLTALKAELAINKSHLESAAIELQSLQTSLNTVTDELQAQAIERDRLARDFALALELNDQSAKTKAKIERELVRQRLLIEALRESDNEQTRNWANTPVPDDVQRLLKQAAYCAHRSHQADPVCAAAEIVNQPVLTRRM